MIVKIIFKKLRGHLNKEEEILFKKWLASNKENPLTYKRLKDYQHYYGKLPNIHNLNPNEAWEAITTALQKNKSKKHPRNFNSGLLRYAAIFIGVVGSVIFYRSLDRNAGISPQQDSTKIILELSNGETQLLSQQGTTTILNVFPFGMLIVLYSNTTFSFALLSFCV